MPRRIFAGCFNLPCIQKDCSVKNDLRDLSLEEEIPAKKAPVDLTSEDLKQYTCQFSPENLIGATQFGKLYRGRMSIGYDQDEVRKDVVVKIVGVDERLEGFRVNGKQPTIDDKLPRLEDELKFLQDPRIKVNPNLAKVIGFCREDEMLGVVYDLNPHDTLYNLITRDDFKWLPTVKTALALARLLNYLHDGNLPYMIRNFDPAHIVVDQNFTPILTEFGMVIGGVLGYPINEELRIGPHGYIDPYVIVGGADAWSVKSDVFAFGVLLVNLMMKRVFKRFDVSPDVTPWFLEKHLPRCSLVHQSLKDDPEFYLCDGQKILKLAKQCVDEDKHIRPEMKQVVKRLKTLRIVKQHGGDKGAW